MQIGNAITEKKLLDVILQARDRGLFHAITDCGAGGFSSAVGEMGAKLGAGVELEQAPLKYAGPVVHRDLDLRGAGAHGPGRAARKLAGPARSCATARMSRRRSRHVRRHGQAAAALPRRAGRPIFDGLPARRPAGASCARRRVDAAAPTARSTLHRPRARLHGGSASRLLGALKRLQQGMDHPPVRPRGAGRQRDQAAGRAYATTAPATRR